MADSMSLKDSPAARVAAHVAQYLEHPSREYYFKVKSPFQLLQREQGVKRQFSHISTDAALDVKEEDGIAARASETLCLYQREIARVCTEIVSAKQLLGQTAALECRHLRMAADDVASNEAETENAPRGVVSLTDFLFAPSMPWSARIAVQLVTLDLEQNLLGDVGVERLCAHVLPRTKCLQRLLLASNQIRQDGLAHLCAFLQRPLEGNEKALPHLATLGLTNNELCQSSAETPASQPFSVGKSLAQILLLYKRTARRLHLNHIGLKTQDVVDMLVELFADVEAMTTRDNDHFPRFETIYLKQNDAVRPNEVEACLGQLTTSDAHKCFLTKHILL